MDCTKKDNLSIFHIIKDRKNSAFSENVLDSNSNEKWKTCKQNLQKKLKKGSLKIELSNETKNSVKIRKFSECIQKKRTFQQLENECELNFLHLNTSIEEKKGLDNDKRIDDENTINNHKKPQINNSPLSDPSNSSHVVMKFEKTNFEVKNFSVPNFLNDRKPNLVYDSVKSWDTSTTKHSNSNNILPYEFENKELYVVKYRENKYYNCTGNLNFNEDVFFNFD